MTRSCHVLAKLPKMCGAKFVDARQSVRLKLRCSRVDHHKGDHHDVVLGFVWSNGQLAKRAWRALDASDLTIHFDCGQSGCPWSPRAC